MSNFGFENYLQQNAKELIRTQVGDKYVHAKLEENNLLLGGEQSGHIILKNIISTSDGILTTLKLVETLESTNNWDIKTFEKYPQVNINLEVRNKKDLNQSPIKEIIDEHKNLLNSGRIIVRYSGTENLCRIMAEAENLDLANQVINSLANNIKMHLL